MTELTQKNKMVMDVDGWARALFLGGVRLRVILAELAGDLYSQAWALRTSALCYKSCGDIQNIVFLCQRAQKLLELCGATTGSAYETLSQDLAEAQLLKSEYAEARHIYTEFARDTGAQDPYMYAWALLTIAQLDIISGASKQDVVSNLDKAMALFDDHRHGYSNVVFPKIHCNIELGKLHLREGEIVIAKGTLLACFKSAWGNNAQGALSCMESFANVKDWPESDFHWASGWAVIYLGYAKKLGDKIALHRALQFLGDVFQAEGDTVTSTALFTVALETFTWMDIHRSRAECMLRLGDLAKGQGHVSRPKSFGRLPDRCLNAHLNGNKLHTLMRGSLPLPKCAGGHQFDTSRTVQCPYRSCG
ncbi:hypothetical protein FB451DRAFT_1184378 [Mycena latifolia]|nr:hypothetical protein FB451DRAFT_1184378 [Mycena latifolia]